MPLFNNMGLNWPDVGDSTYPAETDVAVGKVDAHDHSSGKGVLIPAAGLASNSVTTVKIADANVTTDKIADANVTTAKILDANVTTSKIADAAITQAKRASLGQQISSSSGTYSTTSTSVVAVTNLTLSITTTGRPVMLMLISDVGVSSFVISYLGSTFYFYRGSTELSQNSMDATDLMLPAGCFAFVDIVAAGTYTYTFRGRCSIGGSIGIRNCRLVAFEL